MLPPRRSYKTDNKIFTKLFLTSPAPRLTDPRICKEIRLINRVKCNVCLPTKIGRARCQTAMQSISPVGGADILLD